MTGGGASSWDESIRGMVKRYSNLPVAVRLAFGVVLTWAITASIASTRGDAVALLAAVVYGGVFGVGAFSAGRIARWAKRHPWLNGAMVAAIFGPMVFLSLADSTHLALPVCALVGVGADAFLVPAMVVRWRREALG